MRRVLADALDRQGFDVVATAGDGDEALAACAEHRPDALTLDLAMPGIDGMSVLRALRDGRAEPVPVVVVSAFSPAHGARAVDALAEGAFDLVAKPALGEPASARSPRSSAARSPPRPAPRGAASRRRPAAPRRRRRPPPPRSAGRATGSGRARRHRLLDRRPEGARRAGPAPAQPARRRHADRPAHAARASPPRSPRAWTAASALTVREAGRRRGARARRRAARARRRRTCASASDRRVAPLRRGRRSAACARAPT